MAKQSKIRRIWFVTSGSIRQALALAIGPITTTFDYVTSRRGRDSRAFTRPSMLPERKRRAPTLEEWEWHKKGKIPNPLIGIRFVEADMRGCMAHIRHKERWGLIVNVDVGRALRGLVYDGGSSREMREWRMKRGQDTWLHVIFDDGKESFEPLMDCLYPTMYREGLQGQDFFVERQI